MENRLKREGRCGEGRYKVNKVARARIHACADLCTAVLGAGKEALLGTRTCGLLLFGVGCLFAVV